MAREVIVAPPAEPIIKDILREGGLSLPVYIDLPTKLPATEFVQVVQIGSNDPNIITDAPRLIVKVTGLAGNGPNDTLTCKRLAAHVLGLVKASPGSTYPSGKVRSFALMGGLSSVPDTDVDRPRMQFVCELRIKAGAI